MGWKAVSPDGFEFEEFNRSFMEQRIRQAGWDPWLWDWTMTPILGEQHGFAEPTSSRKLGEWQHLRRLPQAQNRTTSPPEPLW